MVRAIKYELRPNKTQSKKLDQSFGNCRFIYNWALNKKTKTYESSKKILSAYDLMKELTALKKQEEFTWLNLTGSQQLQQSIFNMEKAFKNFYERIAGFPKFKSKNHKQSFRIPQDIKIDYEQYRFFVPKIGWIKFYKDKKIQGNVKSATVSKTTTGRYFVSIDFEMEDNREYGEGVVGVDLGIKNFAITSDGEIFENQKYLERSLKKLRVEQRSLKRKFKKGAKEQSKNYYKQKIKVAKLHEKIANQRKDYLHKITTYLATTYETVCIENLDVDGMMKNRYLSRSISDTGWRMFRTFLEYKTENLRVIDRFEPTSKVCNICGDKKEDLKLSDREWICKNGHKLDRDLNAALNIKNIGLRVSTFDVNVE